MSQLSNCHIISEIDIDKNHIDNFPLECEKGTKKLKDKFHKNAVNERNKYVEKQKKLFDIYNKKVYYELNDRVEKMYPINNENMFIEMNKTIDRYENYVIESNTLLNVSFRMNFDFLISNIKDNSSLEQFNSLLLDFINRFKSAGIDLSVKDFDYSMFTEKYMSMFFSNYNDSNFNSIASECFEKVYFECPKIIMHMRLNLKNILRTYEVQLEKYLASRVSNDLAREGITSDNLLSTYLKSKNEIKWVMGKDPYSNLKLFLDKELIITDYLVNSPICEKNFSTFVNSGSYLELSDEEKNKYHNVIREFSDVLSELKEYYRYEFLLKDIVKRYKDKEKSKGLFEAKSKEIATVEKNRLKLVKDYAKSLKPNLFGKINHEKSKVCKFHLNEEMVNLDKLYYECNDLEFNKLCFDNLNDTSSIYDFISMSLSSFQYMEKMFTDKFKDEDNFDLEKEVSRFIKFLYNPYNEFMRKINALVDYDVTKVIADKYTILGLKISFDDISKDNISMTESIINYIVKVLLLEENSLNISKIKFICDVKNLSPLDGWKYVYEEII